VRIKPALFAVMLFFCIGNSNAQPFGANGATWHFNSSTFFPPHVNTPIVVNASQPFMIGSDTCRTISSSWVGGCSSMTSYIVTQRNDSVLYFSVNQNDFVLLYNYNAMVGDTQTIYAPNVNGIDTSVQLLVISTDSININGFNKRRYVTIRLTYYFDFGGAVIEDIGSTGFPFPQFGFCDPINGGIRCYEDSIVGLYNFNPVLGCDSIWGVGLDDLNEKDDIIIYPNPFNFYLTIFNISPLSESDIIIRDPLGRAIKSLHYEVSPNQNSVSIDLNALRNGIYFLEVVQEKSHWVKKVIKK